MTDQPVRRGVITYDGLPISSGGGHRLRTKGIARSWEAMRRFLDRCTTASLDAPAPRTRVAVYAFEGPLVDSAVSTRAIARLRELAPDGEQSHQQIAPAARVPETNHRFAIPPGRRQAALDLLAEGEPWPEHWYGPVVLVAELRFHLRDPRTGAVLPGQGAEQYGNQRVGSAGWLGESHLKLTLGALRAACLWLSIPMAEPDASFHQLVAALQAELPFTLSAKHWKRWTPRSRGSGLAGHPLRLER